MAGHMGQDGSFRGQKPTYKFLAVVFVATFNFDIASGDGVGNSGYSIGRWGQLCFGGTDGFSKGHTVVNFDAFPGTYQWHSKNKIWKNFEKFLKISAKISMKKKQFWNFCQIFIIYEKVYFYCDRSQILYRHYHN